MNIFDIILCGISGLLAFGILIGVALFLFMAAYLSDTEADEDDIVIDDEEWGAES